MAKATEITRDEMHDFLTRRGFTPLSLAGVKELVYGRIVAHNLSLRVYTSIVGDSSRSVGKDAIRTVLVTRVYPVRTDAEDIIKLVGSDRRVHRVEGWRSNLQDRLDRWQEQVGPVCPKCGRMTVKRQSARGPFWGCCAYPVCKSITPLASKPVSGASDSSFDAEG